MLCFKYLVNNKINNFGMLKCFKMEANNALKDHNRIKTKHTLTFICVNYFYLVLRFFIRDAFYLYFHFDSEL